MYLKILLLFLIAFVLIPCTVFATAVGCKHHLYYVHDYGSGIGTTTTYWSNLEYSCSGGATGTDNSEKPRNYTMTYQKWFCSQTGWTLMEETVTNLGFWPKYVGAYGEAYLKAPPSNAEYDLPHCEGGPPQCPAGDTYQDLAADCDGEAYIDFPSWDEELCTGNCKTCNEVKDQLEANCDSIVTGSCYFSGPSSAPTSLNVNYECTLIDCAKEASNCINDCVNLGGVSTTNPFTCVDGVITQPCECVDGVPPNPFDGFATESKQDVQISNDENRYNQLEQIKSNQQQQITNDTTREQQLTNIQDKQDQQIANDITREQQLTDIKDKQDLQLIKQDESKSAIENVGASVDSVKNAVDLVTTAVNSVNSNVEITNTELASVNTKLTENKGVLENIKTSLLPTEAEIDNALAEVDTSLGQDVQDAFVTTITDSITGKFDTIAPVGDTEFDWFELPVLNMLPASSTCQPIDISFKDKQLYIDCTIAEPFKNILGWFISVTTIYTIFMLVITGIKPQS